MTTVTVVLGFLLIVVFTITDRQQSLAATSVGMLALRLFLGSAGAVLTIIGSVLLVRWRWIHWRLLPKIVVGVVLVLVVLFFGALVGVVVRGV